MRANDRDDQIRPLNHLLDLVPKIRSRWNGIKIHEDVLLPEFRLQPVIKPPGNGQRVFPAIGDGDHRLVVNEHRDVTNAAGKLHTELFCWVA